MRAFKHCSLVCTWLEDGDSISETPWNWRNSFAMTKTPIFAQDEGHLHHRTMSPCTVFCIIQPSAIFSFQGRNEPMRGQGGEFLRTNEKCRFKWYWSCAPIRIKLDVYWAANEKTVQSAWFLKTMKHKACSRKTTAVKLYWVWSKEQY